MRMIRHQRADEEEEEEASSDACQRKVHDSEDLHLHADDDNTETERKGRWIKERGTRGGRGHKNGTRHCPSPPH